MLKNYNGWTPTIYYKETGAGEKKYPEPVKKGPARLRNTGGGGGDDPLASPVLSD